MIVHKIITYKPTLPQLPPKYGQHHTNLFPINTNGLPYNFTQEDVLKYVADAPIHLGDFVVSSYVQQQITGLYQISFVISVERVNGLTHSPRSWSRGHPCIYKLVQLYSHGPTPWVRMEAHPDYRKLTEEEFNTWIVTNLDSIRNYIQKYREADKTLKESCTIGPQGQIIQATDISAGS
jgi:hypothetical protein